ncbi:SGNH/GDSL hydrolase family protein [Pseudomonas putida]|nr:SGNH/GDSL hydrolase family protein [Pseudomonas putida]
MTVASELARLTQTIDSANELFLSDQIKMMDVGDGVMRPTNAKAVADLAAQMSGAMIYSSTGLGLEGTPSGGHFSVISPVSDEYLSLYRNDGGVAFFVDSYPNASKVREVSDGVVAVDSKVDEMLSKTSYSAPEVETLIATDEEGGKLLTLSNKRLATEPFEISSDINATIIGDSEGGVAAYVDGDRYLLGSFEVLRTAQSGMFVTDEEGGVLTDLSGATPGAQAADPFELGPLFAPVIATAEGYTQFIDVQSMLAKRELVSQVIGSVASTSTSASETKSTLPIPFGKFGSAAVLNLRDVRKPNIRKFMSLSLKNVPVQATPTTPKILIIGDSICNRQGGQLLRQILQALGFAPSFIGTLHGSANANNLNDVSGELGEARESWETGDFTYAVTDRAVVVEPGGEAAYMALPKAEKVLRNPFLRAATESDPADIVRNGYVFDPAYYQARLSLQAPDIVLNLLGTNDVRDRNEVNIYDAVLANDTLMHSQIRAAWPSAKIVRSVPGTSLTSARNLLWTSRYVPMIKAMQQSAFNRADPKLTLAPLWALTNPEVGYSFTVGPVGVEGFSTSDWADPLHPIQASRQALFEAVAPYIAAAAANII